MVSAPLHTQLEVPETHAPAFRRAIAALCAHHIPFTLGGGLAIQFYTGIRREVHDLDIHLMPQHVLPALEALDQAGFVTWIKFQAWLAQARSGEVQVDLVFGQGSWHASVDQAWLDRGVPISFLGHEVKVSSPEDLIWSKALRCSRLRHDAADLFHILAAQGGYLNWELVIERFGPDWEVLASHLVMFRYVFPREAAEIPSWVHRELFARLAETWAQPPPAEPVCRGLLLDSTNPYDQYFSERGYRDERQERWEERLRQEPCLYGLDPEAHPQPRWE